MRPDSEVRISALVLLAISALSVLSVLSVFSLLSIPLFASASTSDIPPPVHGIQIYEYGKSINQSAGTEAAYEVQVQNTGVLDLTDVKLKSDKIPCEWFSTEAVSNSSKTLKFGEIVTLDYKLKIPADAAGEKVFSIIAYGSYGVGSVSDIKPVLLNITPQPNITPGPGTVSRPSSDEATTGICSANITETTETTESVEKSTSSSTSTFTPTSIPPTSPITGIIDATSKEIQNFTSLPEKAFSRVRAFVAYARADLSDMFADGLLLSQIAAVLFVIVLILVGARKILNI